MDGVGAPDALRPGLAQPQMPDLTLFDEPGHRADGVLDRHCRIDPVLVIEIDDIDTEALEARVARLCNIGGAPVDSAGAARPAGFGQIWHHHPPGCPAPPS